MATTSASWRTARREADAAPDEVLQFGHDVSVVENIRPVFDDDADDGFNLATTSASWRTVNEKSPTSRKAMLQFGHDVSVVENPRTRVRRSVDVPLQFGHDVSVVEN